MLESHKEQNGVWVEKMRTENDQERRALAEERVSCVWTQFVNPIPCLNPRVYM